MKIGKNFIGENQPTYFIADLAANHDGDIERAKDLIFMSAEAGANAAKFQHFNAETIVSSKGFENLGSQKSHQSKWKKSVYEVYSDASVSLEWTEEILDTCRKANIDFFTSPYSLNLVDYIDNYVPAFKIGSGDITWTEIISHIASKSKPYMIATGASSIEDVERAVKECVKINNNLVLMQCNTNYTASLENFSYVNLRVIETFKSKFPELIIGLSDHTPGHSTVLGAIALGARVIEKHFTDNTKRSGPDHAFSMTPKTWRNMVDRSRELEAALGDGIKRIEDNELETVILQRRSIRLRRNMLKGEIVKKEDLEFLRPCPKDGIEPYQLENIVGRKLLTNLESGEHIKWSDID